MPLQKCHGATPVAHAETASPLHVAHLQQRCPANRPRSRLTIRQRPLPLAHTSCILFAGVAYRGWIVRTEQSTDRADNLHSVGMLSFGGVT